MKVVLDFSQTFLLNAKNVINLIIMMLYASLSQTIFFKYLKYILKGCLMCRGICVISTLLYFAQNNENDIC